MSHELRTPLTSISGYLEIMLEEEDEPLSDHQRRHFLHVIDRNARRLERLVGDLLFVARLEEGSLRLEPAAVDRLTQRALGHRRVALVYVDTPSFAGMPSRQLPLLLRLQSVGVPVAVVRASDELGAALEGGSAAAGAAHG